MLITKIELNEIVHLNSADFPPSILLQRRSCVHTHDSQCAFLTRTSSERKAPAKCILLSPGAVAPTYLHTAFAWDINVMQVVKATRHEIHASPRLSRESAIRDLEALED